MKKRFLTLALTLLSAVGAWAYDFEVDGIYYGFSYDSSNEVYVTYGDTQPSGEITIPSSVSYNGQIYSVTSIEREAFKNCSALTSVTIPNSVTSIGSSAFESCTSLTSVTIPNSVTSIGSFAFYGCTSLTSVTIPNSVTSIKNDAFYGCSALTNVYYNGSVTDWCQIDFSNAYSNPLSNGANFYINNQLVTDLVIPDEVTTIKSYAFYGCSALTSVTIPNSVTSIGDRAFRGCSALSHIRCEATTPPTLNDDVFGMTSFQLVFVPTGTATAYANAWGNNYTYIDSETEITVHVETAGQLAAAIVAQGATPARVTKLTVTGTLNEADFNIIKSNMPRLYNLDLSGISNTTLPNEAFYQKRALLSIALPNGLTEIPNNAFSGCSALTSVTIPNSVTSIGGWAFESCTSLTSVTIPNSVTSIGSFAFYGCTSLTSVTIPNSVTNIRDYAFAYCTSLTSVTIPNSVTSIGEQAFNGCSALTSVTIPNSVTSIGGWAFAYCTALTSVTIPNSVTSIREGYAFAYCTSLTSVTIGNKVQDINSNTFSGCSQLDTITCLGSVPPTVNENFATINPTTCKLYVPNNALMDYILAPVWGTFLQMEGIDVNYQLTLQMNEGGEISCNNHDYTDTTELTFAAGTEVSLKLMPDAGYSVSEVWVNDEDYTDQITEDMTLNLTLKSDATVSVSFYRAHLVNFVNTDGTVLQSNYVEYGEMPYYDNWETPYLPSTAEYDYEFTGWTPELTAVTADITYTATYNAIKRSYLISFYDEDYSTLLHSEYMEYGVMPEYNGMTPTKPSTNEYDYTFSGWSPELQAVSGEASYYATYTANRKAQYTISYYSEGSGSYFLSTCYAGGDFHCCVLPHEGYTIASVTLNGEDITELLDADGNIYLYDIQQNMVIVVSTTATPSEVSSTKPSRLRAWQADGTLFVEVDDAVEAVMVYDVTGRLMQEYQHNGGYQMLNLPAPNKVNLVKVVSKDGSVNSHKLM